MTIDQLKQRFRGPMISVATPFTEDFKLDLETLKRNIRYMVDHGVTTGQGSLLVAAAGGEFPMLTMEERKAVIQASVEAAAGQAPVATSIQFNWSEESAELARFAAEAGAELGQLSAPFYYRATEKDIVRHFQIVSEKSDLPLMIYANWWITGDTSIDMVEALTEVPNVMALKWASHSSAIFTEGLRRFSHRLLTIDNQLEYIQGRLLGADGFITHVSNFWPEYPLAVWNLLQQDKFSEMYEKLKDFKWEWRKWVRKVMNETEGEGPFIKAAMNEVGLPSGPPRQPAQMVSVKLREELHKLFVRAGVPRAS